MARVARYVVGCMTGTSLDALDAALVRIAGTGLDIAVEYVGAVSTELGELAGKLHHFAAGAAAAPIDYLRAARALGELHAMAIAALVEQHLPPGAAIDFVAAHGQTIWHAPDEHLSWQLFDPWPIVRRLGAPVCYDLRQADLIAGGQGAPITPLADWVIYRAADRSRLIVNLGGICNVTMLRAGGGPDQVTGGDIGPCNLLLDGIVRALYPQMRYDVDGRLAALGTADGALDQAIREHPFFAGDTSSPRSAGREQFTDAWVGKLVERFKSTLTEKNFLASAVESVALRIAETVAAHRVDEVVLAGGGARNAALVARIRRHIQRADAHLIISDALGIPIEAREAVGFAVLGALSRDGVAITLGQVTGAERPGRAGAWVYP